MPLIIKAPWLGAQPPYVATGVELLDIYRTTATLALQLDVGNTPGSSSSSSGGSSNTRHNESSDPTTGANNINDIIPSHVRGRDLSLAVTLDGVAAFEATGKDASVLSQFPRCYAPGQGYSTDKAGFYTGDLYKAGDRQVLI